MGRLKDFLRRLPWWSSIVLGLACVLLGLALLAKPFASLSVLVLIVAANFIFTGVSELVDNRTSTRSRLMTAAGLGWIAAGLVALAWPALTIRGMAVIVGITMLIGGLARIFAGIRRTADDRWISLLSGLAHLAFGVLALTWPDVSVLVVALLVGPAISLFGVGQIARGYARRPWHDEDPSIRSTEREGSRWSRRTRMIGTSLSLILALGLLGLSAWLHDSTPEIDAFYDPPNTEASGNGVLLRAEPFTRAIPDDARAWRILYTTTRVEGVPAVASAIVLAARQVPDGPRPVIAWAHGTTGVARPCAPSLLDNPLSAGATPVLDQIIANGWVLVATDYVGLGTSGPHPYLIGEGEARSVLDAVLAARQMDELSMEDRTVVWGHSQGGHAALWTGILAPQYAPDVNVIGVAALAPASDLVKLADEMHDDPVNRILQSYIVRAYSETYPSVRFNDYIRPEARTIVREVAGRCLSEPSTLISIAVGLPLDGPIYSRNPVTGPLGDQLTANVPAAPIEAPLLVAQGGSDTLILASMQEQYVAGLCAAGQRLEYRTYEGQGHVDLVEANSPLIPDLIRWTEDRLAGLEQPAGCQLPDD